MVKQRVKSKFRTDLGRVQLEHNVGQEVLKLARQFLHKESYDPLPGLDILAFCHTLEAHGLGGIAGSMAIQGQIKNIELHQWAEKRYMTNLLYNERANRVVDKIANTCIENRIPLVMLKGPALVAQAYLDQGMRGFGDVDLFFSSREDISNLALQMEAHSLNDKGRSNLGQRFRNPAKLEAQIDGVAVEMMHPPRLPTDAMQNIIQVHQPFALPESAQSIYQPNPSLHFVFLILHMMINHFCTRLIWFIDLILLYREQADHIDWPWVEQEFKRLQMSNLADAIIVFCNDILGAELPPIESNDKAWNKVFIRYMLEPGTVLSRRLGVQYASSSRRRVKLYLLNLFGFYLSNDPQGANEASSIATRHMTNRFLYAVNANSKTLAWLLRPFCWLVYWPLARLSVNSFKRSLRKNTKLISMHHQ